jgi:hypothetical protein
MLKVGAAVTTGTNTAHRRIIINTAVGTGWGDRYIRKSPFTVFRADPMTAEEVGLERNVHWTCSREREIAATGKLPLAVNHYHLQ